MVSGASERVPEPSKHLVARIWLFVLSSFRLFALLALLLLALSGHTCRFDDYRRMHQNTENTCKNAPKHKEYM